MQEMRFARLLPIQPFTVILKSIPQFFCRVVALLYVFFCIVLPPRPCCVRWNLDPCGLCPFRPKVKYLLFSVSLESPCAHFCFEDSFFYHFSSDVPLSPGRKGKKSLFPPSVCVGQNLPCKQPPSLRALRIEPRQRPSPAAPLRAPLLLSPPPQTLERNPSTLLHTSGVWTSLSSIYLTFLEQNNKAQLLIVKIPFLPSACGPCNILRASQASSA